MIFIFGTRRKALVLATISMACRNGHTAAHRLMKFTYWFTLFFIPVIPMQKKFQITCIQCGLTQVMPKQNAEELIANVRNSNVQGAQGQDPVSAPIPLATVNPNNSLPPAGWYKDPTQENVMRYWDGNQWTESITNSQQ